MAKLMKPLFIGGMYNREGKRIRVNYLKTICDYPIWINDGKPDKDYPNAGNDKYYLYIQHDEWIVMCGYTEYQLIEKAGIESLNRQWYGDFQGREKYFQDNFYNGRSTEEAHTLIKMHIAKENEYIKKEGENELKQAELLKDLIDQSIARYIDARDQGGKFADFIGALFLNELDQCDKISSVLKLERKQKEIERQKAIAEQKAKEVTEKEQAEKLLIKETENIFINGGTIKDGSVIVKIADKYNVDIPLRTRGWILNNFAESTIENNSISCRYWKTKNGTGSTRIYDILHSIRKAILQSA